MTVFYLMQNDDGIEVIIIRDADLQAAEKLGCIRITSSYTINPLISKGFVAAKELNYHFAGLKEEKEIKTKQRIYNRELKARAPVISPMKLKHHHNKKKK